MSENQHVGGDKPRKSLILNAFVEMCMSSFLQGNQAELLSGIQAAGTSPPDFGVIPKTSRIDSTTSTTGSSWQSCSSQPSFTVSLSQTCSVRKVVPSACLVQLLMQCLLQEGTMCTRDLEISILPSSRAHNGQSMSHWQSFLPWQRRPRTSDSE